MTLFGYASDNSTKHKGKTEQRRVRPGAQVM